MTTGNSKEELGARQVKLNRIIENMTQSTKFSISHHECVKLSKSTISETRRKFFLLLCNCVFLQSARHLFVVLVVGSCFRAYQQQNLTFQRNVVIKHKLDYYIDTHFRNRYRCFLFFSI